MQRTHGDTSSRSAQPTQEVFLVLRMRRSFRNSRRSVQTFQVFAHGRSQMQVLREAVRHEARSERSYEQSHRRTAP